MALCKINVGNNFISLWRLLHCESCGCYQKGDCFLNGLTQSPPVAGSLQQLHWKWAAVLLQEAVSPSDQHLILHITLSHVPLLSSTAMSWPKFMVLLQDVSTALLLAALSSVNWLWLMLVLLSAPHVKWRIILLVKKWICDRFVCNLWALFMPELGNPLLSGNEKHLLDFLPQQWQQRAALCLPSSFDAPWFVIAGIGKHKEQVVM